LFGRYQDAQLIVSKYVLLSPIAALDVIKRPFGI